MTIERLDTLEGISLDDDIPCGVIVEINALQDRLCGKPSVARVKITCPNCGVDFIFVCDEHLECLQAGDETMSCNDCGVSFPDGYLYEGTV
jgi:predicted RNA-binding Zn-ribbon protein involved in translation (DUF1610 family)